MAYRELCQTTGQIQLSLQLHNASGLERSADTHTHVQIIHHHILWVVRLTWVRPWLQEERSARQFIIERAHAKNPPSSGDTKVHVLRKMADGSKRRPTVITVKGKEGNNLVKGRRSNHLASSCHIPYV